MGVAFFGEGGITFGLLGCFSFHCSENVVVVSNWWGHLAQYNEKCYNRPHEQKTLHKNYVPHTYYHPYTNSYTGHSLHTLPLGTPL